ncbi:hypothetical protein HKX48_006226 [Thoreauomyces humboldtii]|nr:hypothetical protein HKX48_006226 [Thoreauomyces humboldtii]
MARDSYTRLLDGMLMYHAGFRRSIATIQSLLPGTQSVDARPSLLTILSTASSLAQHLDVHHSIEERYIFPLLAKRMPAEFGMDHLKEHHVMYDHLKRFAAYAGTVQKNLVKARKTAVEGGDWDKNTYDEARLTVLVKQLGDALLFHLDHEEHSLHADQLRKAGFSAEELDAIHM